MHGHDHIRRTTAASVHGVDKNNVMINNLKAHTVVGH